MTHIEAMKQALEALEENHHLIEEYERPDYLAHYDRVITSLRQAIAATEESSATQEPVAKVDESGWFDWLIDYDLKDCFLYTHPPVPQGHKPKADHIPDAKKMVESLREIGDFAHDKSTGPEVPDALWEIRYMAYEAIEPMPAQPKAEQDELHKAIGILQGLLTDALNVLDSSAIDNIGPLKDKMRAAALPWDRLQKAEQEPKREPLTHEQRFDLLTSFEPHKNKWEAPAILIDMVEAAHGITKVEQVKWSDYESDGRIIKNYPEKDKT